MVQHNDVNASLSPLDQIRQVEADVARQIRQAQDAAGEKIRQARLQAAEIKREALKAGGQEGESDYAEALGKAEREAQQIRAETDRQTAEMIHTDDERVEMIATRALTIILGRQEEVDLP